MTGGKDLRVKDSQRPIALKLHIDSCLIMIVSPIQFLNQDMRMLHKKMVSFQINIFLKFPCKASGAQSIGIQKCLLYLAVYIGQPASWANM